MVNVKPSVDTTTDGMEMNRVAEIDGKFYPYYFSLRKGQVQWTGPEFAKHTESGIKYVSQAFDTLAEAESKFECAK